MKCDEYLNGMMSDAELVFFFLKKAYLDKYKNAKSFTEVNVRKRQQHAFMNLFVYGVITYKGKERPYLN